MKIEQRPRHWPTAVHYQQVARYAEITSERKERQILWQWDDKKEDIFMTCPGCSAISRIQSPDVGAERVIRNCVVCSNCSTHFFVKLEGWDGPLSVSCPGCNLKSKITKEKPVPDGWSMGNGCQCAACRRAFFCAKCSKSQ